MKFEEFLNKHDDVLKYYIKSEVVFNKYGLKNVTEYYGINENMRYTLEYVAKDLGYQLYNSVFDGINCLQLKHISEYSELNIYIIGNYNCPDFAYAVAVVSDSEYCSISSRVDSIVRLISILSRYNSNEDQLLVRTWDDNYPKDFEVVSGVYSIGGNLEGALIDDGKEYIVIKFDEEFDITEKVLKDKLSNLPYVYCNISSDNIVELYNTYYRDRYIYVGYNRTSNKIEKFTDMIKFAKNMW